MVLLYAVAGRLLATRFESQTDRRGGDGLVLALPGVFVVWDLCFGALCPGMNGASAGSATTKSARLNVLPGRP